MAYKSRGSYKSFCLRRCENRGKLCDVCIRYSHFKSKTHKNHSWTRISKDNSETETDYE